MICELHKKHRSFLKTLKDLNELNIIKLTDTDRHLIGKALTSDCYFDEERDRLERLRKRFQGPRDNANSNEYF